MLVPIYNFFGKLIPIAFKREVEWKHLNTLTNMASLRFNKNKNDNAYK